MGLSDFTDMADLAVTVAGQPLDHRLYHFRLAYSGFEHAHVVLGGESYVALAEGLQNALWALGGAPREHRSDSLSAAFRNLGSRRPRGPDPALRCPVRPLRHGAEPQQSPASPTRTAPSRACMATSRRRSRMPCCCAARATSPILSAYRRFVDEVVGRRNARATPRIEVERAALQELPDRRTADYEEAIVTVTSTSGFVLRKVFYSVPSRLIGHRLRVRLYDDRLEVYLGGTHQMTLPRGRAHPNGRHGHVVDYRHVIHSLRRKPMALIGLVYRDQLFPRPAYARAFEAMLRQTARPDRLPHHGRSARPGP